MKLLYKGFGLHHLTTVHTEPQTRTVVKSNNPYETSKRHIIKISLSYVINYETKTYWRINQIKKSKH